MIFYAAPRRVGFNYYRMWLGCGFETIKSLSAILQQLYSARPNVECPLLCQTDVTYGLIPRGVDLIVSPNILYYE